MTVMRGHRIRRTFAGMLLGGIALLVAGCATPEAAVEPEGTLDVLGPFPGFADKGLPDDWVFDGARDAKTHLASVSLGGVPALKIENTDTPFTAALRAKALLLTTPFLSWAWNMETAEGGDHPVRLVVGFWQSKDGEAAWDARPGAALSWPGGTLPPHQRAITITWGESALARGTLTLSKGTRENRAAPRYVARGGRESTGQWWLETVDLADLYARAWPGEDMRRVRITFIGITAEGGRQPTVAHVSGVRLTR